MKSLGGTPRGARLERHQGFAALAGERSATCPRSSQGLRDPNVPMPTLHEFLCGGERARCRGTAAVDDPLEVWSRPPATGLPPPGSACPRYWSRSTVFRVLTRSGLGQTRFAIAARRAPSASTLTVCPSRDAAGDLVLVSHDHYDHLDYPTIRELAKRRALRDVARGRCASRSLGRAARAHRRARVVGIAPVAEHRTHSDRRALAALFRARTEKPQLDPMVLARHPFATARSVLQRRYGPHDRISDDPRTARAVRPRDAGGGRAHPSWRHSPRTGERLGVALLGGGAFLPVHWGTFSLAMHAWDQPVEALLELGPKAGAQLVMPRLGEPVEPAHAEGVEPWWRVVDTAVDTAAPEPEPDTPAATTLPKAMPWPID